MDEINTVIDEIRAQEEKMWNSMAVMRAAVMATLRAADPEILGELFPGAAPVQ